MIKRVCIIFIQELGFQVNLTSMLWDEFSIFLMCETRMITQPIVHTGKHKATPTHMADK